MKAAIKFDRPGRARIELEGFDVSKAVSEVRLSAAANPGTVPRLTLDLIIFDGLDLEGNLEVHLPDETVELLKLLGWTPPGVSDA